MTDAVIIRRRKLGRTSVREIAKNSKKQIIPFRSDKGVAPDAPLYIRWGCTDNVPGRQVVNTAKAIHQVNNKLKFRMILDDAELCPATYVDYTKISAEDANEGIITRPAHHAQGRHFYYTRDLKSLKEIIDSKFKNKSYYCSHFIDKVAEFRVFIGQGRVLCVSKKTPNNPDAIAWNVALGGRFDNVKWSEWPLKGVKTAVEAFNLSDLDFGGVDIMVDKDGNWYVLEINSAPSLTSPYRQQCFAKFFDWIIDNGKERIPLIKELGGHLKFIHPCINPRAKLV